jgi:hypothetical protein
MTMLTGLLSLLVFSHACFNIELEKYINNGYLSSNIDYSCNISVLNDNLFESMTNNFQINKFWFLYSSIPPKKYYGYIGSKDLAEDIASLLWVFNYGFQILREKPFNTYLKNNRIWIISSTIPQTVILKNHPTLDTLIITGGGTYIEIRKKDGKILKIGYHV